MTQHRADELEERAARWLIRREEPEWSAEDQAALDAWLAESMAHKAAFWRLEYGWRKADRLAALRLGLPESARTALSRWRWIAPGLAAAASVLLALFFLVDVRGTDQIESTAHERFSTTVGGYHRVLLKDGSQAELNTATDLRVAISSSRREVWLDRGEAYFHVVHDAARPFVVHAGARTVTVLGTKFSVRLDPDRSVFGVVEGRVRIDEVSGNVRLQSTVITQGEMAIAQGGSTDVLAAADRLSGGLSWRQGLITLDHTTVAEAVAEFNRYNDRKIVVSDPEDLHVRIGGTFQTSSIDAFVYLLREAYGLQVNIDDSEAAVAQ